MLKSEILQSSATRNEPSWVVTGELLHKETDMHSFFSVFVRQTLLKNQPPSFPTKYLQLHKEKSPHKTTVQHKDNKLRQHRDMVAVCARQTAALMVSQAFRVHADTVTRLSKGNDPF